MDRLDRQILALVQTDGRMSVTDIAASVRLSVSSVHRRLRELEQTGTIERYRAVISPARVGLTFEAIIFVTLARTDSATVAAFEQGVTAVANVVEAERLFGDPDYMLRVHARDLAAYQELFDSQLSVLPGVRRLTSTMVMKRVSSGNVLPF